MVLIAETGEIYDRFAIIKKSTYDAGATPTHARAAVKTKRLDLDSPESAMGKAVEEAKATDPRALNAEIERLKKSGTAPALEREVGRLRIELEREKEKNEQNISKSAIKEADIKRIEKVGSDKLANVGGQELYEWMCSMITEEAAALPIGDWQARIAGAQEAGPSQLSNDLRLCVGSRALTLDDATACAQRSAGLQVFATSLHRSRQNPRHCTRNDEGDNDARYRHR